MSDLLLSEDELLLKNMVSEFSSQNLAPKASSYDQSGEFPWDNIRGLAELGLLGLNIEEKYGGSGGTIRQLAIAVEEIAKGCGSTSTIFVAHHSLCTQFIYAFGTEDQKKQFVTPLATGEEIGAFALTEPGAGSDAASMSTTVTKEGNVYVLNGTKLFTTNAEEAETFVVLATRDTSLRTRGIESFIVNRGTKGFSINPQHGKLGMRASSTAELVFDNCIIPSENLLGEEGKGWMQTMQILNASRIAIGAQCVGIAQAAYEASIEYSKQREVFGQHLSDFQSTQWTISDMATKIDAARLLVQRAADLKDKELPYATEASMAKLYGSQVATETANKAVQIHGGTGYFSPTPVERYFRDARVTEIYEGTTEVQRMIIARNKLDL